MINATGAGGGGNNKQVRKQTTDQNSQERDRKSLWGRSLNTTLDRVKTRSKMLGMLETRPHSAGALSCRQSKHYSRQSEVLLSAIY